MCLSLCSADCSLISAGLIRVRLWLAVVLTELWPLLTMVPVPVVSWCILLSDLCVVIRVLCVLLLTSECASLVVVLSPVISVLALVRALPSCVSVLERLVRVRSTLLSCLVTEFETCLTRLTALETWLMPLLLSR